MRDKKRRKRSVGEDFKIQKGSKVAEGNAACYGNFWVKKKKG